MNRLLKKVLLILFFVTRQLIAAQEPQAKVLAIDFEEAWLRMESFNSKLQTLRIDQAAALRNVESLSHLIPGIGFSLSLSRSAPLISSLTNPSNEDLSETDNWSLRGGLDMRLNLKPTVSIENQINALELNLIIIEKEITIRDLKADLKQLFYEIDAGEKTINLQERILNLSRERLQQVEEQYNKGLQSELDLLTAQISVSRDQPVLDKAKIDQEKRMITLRQYLDLEPDSPIELIALEDLVMKSDMEIDDLLPSVLNNMEIKARRVELEIAEKSRRMTGRNLRSPSLGLSLGWSTSINPLLESDSWTKESWNDSLGLGLSLSVPLDPWLKGSEGQKSLQRQDDTIQKSEISLDDSLRKMRDDLNSLLLDLQLSQANINVDELSIELQEKTFKKVRQNYETGRTSLLDLDDSRQELQKALVTLEEEKLKMNLLLLQLDQMIENP